MDASTVVVGSVLVGGLVLSAFFIHYCLQRLNVRGATSIVVLFVGISCWILADTVQLLTPNTPAPVVGIQFRLLGPDLGVVGLFLFGLEYTGRDYLLTRKTMAVLAVKPVVTLLVTVSPYSHLLVEAATDTQPTVGYNLVMTPLFASHTLYAWALLVTGLGLLGHMMVQANYGYQRQIVAIIVAVLVPFLFNFLARTGVVTFDLTSTGFLMTAGIFTYAAFRLRLVDAIPVARQTVLDEMRDVVIVLDENDTIISVNNATRRTFETDGTLVGQPATAVFDNGSLTALEDGQRQEVELQVRGETRYFDVDTSNVQDYRENLLAKVLVCRDVTDQKQREKTLRRREENLRLLKDLQSRFLRHNLRNELNVVQLNAKYLADEDDPEQQQLYETMREKTDKILAWSTKAQTIEQLIELEETVVCDVNEQIRGIVGAMSERHPHVDFETELAAQAWIQAVPQIQQAIENIVDNAARHNTAGDPQVRISSERDGGRVLVHITDNGPGIDEGELEALREREETPLEHSSGFGLWLVYWVVEKSGGTVDFETDGGTTVTLGFETVTPPQRTNGR